MPATRAKVVQILNSYETLYDVGKWKYGNIDVWPVLKHYLAHLHYQLTNERDGKNKAPNKFKLLVSSVKGAAFMLSNTVFSQWKYSKVKYLFLSGMSYREYSESSSFNRYYQIFIDDLDRKQIAYSYIDWDNQHNFPRSDFSVNEVSYIRPIEKGYPVLKHLYKQKAFNCLGELTSLFDNFIDQSGISFTQPKLLNKVTRKLHSIQIHQRYFEAVLKVSKPEAVYQINHYTTASRALSVVCNEMGIPSVDFQHGGIGNLNLAFSGHTSCPDNGYNTMPKYFWLWDNETKAELDKWVENQSYHKTLVGGNPWLTFFKKIDTSTLNKSKLPLLLVTLQFETIDDRIWAAMAETDTKYAWWVRMHPRKLGAVDEIKEKVKTLNLQNVELNLSNSLPLPRILQSCDLHITEYSGATIEARSIGVKSLLISTIGKEMYESYINQGFACFADSTTEIISSINENIKDNRAVNNVLSEVEILESFYSIN